MRQDGLHGLPRRPGGLLQGGPYVVIGGACMRMDNRFVKLIGGNAAGFGATGGDGHVAYQNQPVGIGIQGTNTVGQSLGQHGNNPPRKINAGAAIKRVFVKGIARSHIVADVGNGHQQSPTRLLALFSAQLYGHAKYVIVEIAGRSEEHTSELQSLMRNSYTVFLLKKTNLIEYIYDNK